MPRQGLVRVSALNLSGKEPVLTVCGQCILLQAVFCQHRRAEAYRGPGYHPVTPMVVTACAI